MLPCARPVRSIYCRTATRSGRSIRSSARCTPSSPRFTSGWSLPGATGETRPYAEDIYDELQQVVADLTAIEDRCSGLLTLHASLASKHLAVVSRRLATVATIFLPISVACVVVTVIMLRRRRWN